MTMQIEYLIGGAYLDILCKAYRKSSIAIDCSLRLSYYAKHDPIPSYIMRFAFIVNLLCRNRQ